MNKYIIYNFKWVLFNWWINYYELPITYHLFIYSHGDPSLLFKYNGSEYNVSLDMEPQQIYCCTHFICIFCYFFHIFQTGLSKKGFILNDFSNSCIKLYNAYIKYRIKILTKDDYSNKIVNKNITINLYIWIYCYLKNPFKIYQIFWKDWKDFGKLCFQLFIPSLISFVTNM